MTEKQKFEFEGKHYEVIDGKAEEIERDPTTEKHEETCECGCEKLKHNHYIRTKNAPKWFGACLEEGCECKKFKAKKKAIALEDAEGYYKEKMREVINDIINLPEPQTQKGCDFGKKMSKVRHQENAKKDKNLEPKNHSQVSETKNASLDTPSEKSRTIYGLAPEGTRQDGRNNRQRMRESRSRPDTKEFDLSEKIKIYREIIDLIKRNKLVLPTEKKFAEVLESLIKDIKEFIKRLKEITKDCMSGGCDEDVVMARIDKLAGKNLT